MQWHETVKKKKADDEFIVIYENKVVKTKIIKEQLEIAHLPDHLVIEVKRFMHQGENNHSNAAKLYNEIIVKEQEQISR